MGRRKKGLRSSGVTQPSRAGSELSQILQEISRPAQQVDMLRRIALFKRALDLQPTENTQLWAALQGELGICLSQSPLGNRADNIEMAIEHFHQAMRVYKEKDFPADWAATENNLAFAYNDRIRGDRAENIEMAIEHCHQAMRIYKEKDFPENWAGTKNNLANAYINRIRGDRAENIEMAIEHYRQAMRVYKEKDFPENWAEIKNNLANAYCERIRGDRAENIEMAIENCRQAQMACTEKDFPEKWAMTENNLANAYRDRIRGDRTENIEQAIEHYRQALKVRTKKDFPADWAMTENNLANAYRDRIRGDRTENIEQAIEHYKQALKVRTEKDFPADWAATENNLANAYKDRIWGDRAENIEMAIEYYRQAMTVYKEKDLPEDWAEIKNNLALAYNDRIRGDRAENIEQAIEHYLQALNVYTQKDFPEQWAGTENNLANAYNDRIRGDRAENIEMAIHYYHLALKVYTEKDFPAEWAMTENNLAVAYSDRIRGDRAEKIEQAIEHYRQALKVRTEKDFPEDWAATENNLAIAYSDRIRGDRAENIEWAIYHHERALKVYTEKDFPAGWATTQNNLAVAYSDRIQGDRSENIEQAIHRYDLALKVRTEKDFPEKWAETQNNLAIAYSDRIRGDRAENIELAIHYYEWALKIRTEKDFPEKWAETQNNLAVAYSDRIRGDRAENIEMAIEHYHQTLKVYTPRQFPDRCRGTAYGLGNLCLEDMRFSEAGKAYSLGMEAAEELYRASIFQSSMEAELAETRDLYRRAGYALAKSNKLKEAVVALERGRARGLGDALARDRADLERVQDVDPQAHQFYMEAVQELQSLESKERTGSAGEEKVLPERDLMIKARARLDEAVDRIRRIPGYQSFLAEPGWEEIATAVAEGQPLIYIAPAPEGGVALIVHRSRGDSSVEAVPLEGFSEERLQEHIKIWFEAYGGWQEARQKLIEDKIEAEEYLQAQGKWFDTIEAVTGQLWQEVAEPIYSALQSLKPEKVFLIPTGLLSLLPLHAAWHEVGGRRQYFQDLLPVSYIPSARALVHARRNDRAANRLLAIDEPRLLKPSPLPSSHAEVLAISTHFHDPQILEHEKAGHRAVLQALPTADVAHFSCHGGANWQDPEKSGLLMANDEVLTIKDLFELHLAGARLATLSACETGIPGTRLPDEVVSLPSAFIRAGFAGAIGSLWTVSDKSTAQLMKAFYNNWRKLDKIPVEALRDAQAQVRINGVLDIDSWLLSIPSPNGLSHSDLCELYRTVRKHPFYWAAFYMTGV